MWGLVVKIVLPIIILAGTFFIGQSTGKALQYKTDQLVIARLIQKTNDELEKIPKEIEKQIIVEKEKVVVQYKTIKEEVVKYVETQVAQEPLSQEFVNLHNKAATGNPEYVTDMLDYTEGDAIGPINDNYQAYQECRNKVKYWIEFYSNLQKVTNNE